MENKHPWRREETNLTGQTKNTEEVKIRKLMKIDRTLTLKWEFYTLSKSGALAPKKLFLFDGNCE